MGLSTFSYGIVYLIFDMRPFFSVIIPTLNEEVALPHLLGNLALQTYTKFEVIVSDGHSRDATSRIAAKFAKQLPLQFVRSSKNTKQSPAIQRNNGAAKAKGELFVFLDADSQVSPDFLMSTKNFITSGANRQGIFLPRVVPDTSSKGLRILYELFNFGIYLAHFLPRPLSSVGGVIISKRAFEQIAGYDESVLIGEDHNLVRRVKQAGYGIYHIRTADIIFSLRRVRHEGILRSIWIFFFGIGHALLRGDIQKEYFTYIMGGAPYQKNHASGGFKDTRQLDRDSVA